jgi:hypothetical protein
MDSRGGDGEPPVSRKEPYVPPSEVDPVVPTGVDRCVSCLYSSRNAADIDIDTANTIAACIDQPATD